MNDFKKAHLELHFIINIKKFKILIESSELFLIFIFMNRDFILDKFFK